MRLVELTTLADVRDQTRICQSNGHVQQVAYSTYHDCLTQICLTCGAVVTNLPDAGGRKE